MTPEKWIFGAIKERGISLAFVSEKTGVPYQVLQYASHAGEKKNYSRRLRADEFLSICAAISLDPADCMRECVKSA